MPAETWVIPTDVLFVTSALLAALLGGITAWTSSLARRKSREELSVTRDTHWRRTEPVIDRVELSLMPSQAVESPSNLDQRVAALEANLPGGEGALDIYSSVNEAILATRLESLGRRIDRLENQEMTSGKVISHVFGVLAVLAAILSAALAVVLQVAG